MAFTVKKHECETRHRDCTGLVAGAQGVAKWF